MRSVETGSPHPLDDQSGRDVMAITGIRPSPRVGRILEALLERVWADPGLNTPEGLRAAVAEVEVEVDET